jgi:hypothetical protein
MWHDELLQEVLLMNRHKVMLPIGEEEIEHGPCIGPRRTTPGLKFLVELCIASIKMN